MRSFIYFTLGLIISAFLVVCGIAMYGIIKFSKSHSYGEKEIMHMASEDKIQNGDIIFQTSKSVQSEAIQLATNSRYSHMGIIYFMDNEILVYEAVGPVKFTPIGEWIERGEDGHYVIKRLKNSDQLITPEAFEKMQEVGKVYRGKPYDGYFEWSDERIYCSELVWKIYKQGLGIELGELEKLSSFNLDNTIVRETLKERYKGAIQLNEKVISPIAIFDSDKLLTVHEN